ncbi:hypothetical protein DV706_18480 (plasmid) [Natronorubrum bangense]|uniref:Uncharacterized protein n=1 Tax=Natronorubrum bangense TaxID=61858 RepID=A0A4D6HT30_9EURY|nr:hypothetical protein [Natronorubrum bangense]QCC56711.1 hypothetical protein DV706_18480 [Natronorubrum bangense]
MGSTTGRDLTDRFVIEVSRVGTVDHIVDLDAESSASSPYSPHDLPGVKLCNRSTRSPASEYLSLEDYTDWQGINKVEFDSEAPDEICSYCWRAVRETLEKEKHTSESISRRIGKVGYRLRWKQKGRARKEWYDIIVQPTTTMAELDRLVCRFTTLDDLHLRMYGLEEEYLDSSLNIIPDDQVAALGDPSYRKAGNVTVGDVAEQAMLWEGDRLSLVYDFGTPSQYYCIVKEVCDLEEIDTLFTETELIARTETAAIVDEKRP